MLKNKIRKQEEMLQQMTMLNREAAEEVVRAKQEAANAAVGTPAEENTQLKLQLTLTSTKLRDQETMLSQILTMNREAATDRERLEQELAEHKAKLVEYGA